MLMSREGLRSEKGSAGNARQKLKTADPTSHHKGRPISTNPNLSKIIKEGREKNWSRVPDGCLTPRRTGLLTVGRNITLILTIHKIYLLGSNNEVELKQNIIRLKIIDITVEILR
jgi:hypothetical protein